MRIARINNTMYTPYEVRDIIPIFSKEEVVSLIGEQNFKMLFGEDCGYNWFCISKLQDKQDEEYFIGLSNLDFDFIEE